MLKEVPGFSIRRKSEMGTPKLTTTGTTSGSDTERPGIIHPSVRRAAENHVTPGQIEIFSGRTPGYLEGPQVALLWALGRDNEVRKGQLQPSIQDAGLSKYVASTLILRRK